MTSFDLTGSGHNEPQSQNTCSKKKIELVGTLIDDYELASQKKASSHSNQSIRSKDMKITMNTTQELVEEEKRAKTYPYAQLDSEANELYSILVDIQQKDPDYNDILQIFGDRK